MNEAHPFFLLAIDDDRQTLELIHSALDDDGTEVLIERDVEFGRKNLFWIEGVIVAKCLQNFPGLDTGPAHQRV